MLKFRDDVTPGRVYCISTVIYSVRLNQAVTFDNRLDISIKPSIKAQPLSKITIDGSFTGRWIFLSDGLLSAAWILCLATKLWLVLVISPLDLWSCHSVVVAQAVEIRGVVPWCRTYNSHTLKLISKLTRDDRNLTIWLVMKEAKKHKNTL